MSIMDWARIRVRVEYVLKRNPWSLTNEFGVMLGFFIGLERWRCDHPYSRSRCHRGVLFSHLAEDTKAVSIARSHCHNGQASTSYPLTISGLARQSIVQRTSGILSSYKSRLFTGRRHIAMPSSMIIALISSFSINGLIRLPFSLQ